MDSMSTSIVATPKAPGFSMKSRVPSGCTDGSRSKYPALSEGTVTLNVDLAMRLEVENGRLILADLYCGRICFTTVSADSNTSITSTDFPLPVAGVCLKAFESLDASAVLNRTKPQPRTSSLHHTRCKPVRLTPA